SPVQNLSYEIDGDQLTLKWEASETNGEILLVKEDFTEYDPVSLLPTGWTAIDADEDGNGWRAGGNSYLYDGLHVAISFSSWNGLPDLNPDNYLITPEVSGASRITYLVTSGDYNWPDHYGVFISKTGTAAADFVHLFDETLTATGPSQKSLMKDGRWYQFQARELILPEGTKYVAFRHYDSSDMFAVVVTQVRVYGKTVARYNIYKDGSLLQTDVEGMSFTTPLPAQTSEYCVRAVVDGVESDPACVTVEMTALSVPNAQAIEISGEVGCIRIATTQPETMRLFDLQGRMLLTREVKGQVSVSIAAGIYVVQVGSIKQKVIVR
ncbi:choice-of-anchor J domain-containing protein, partial [Bacteroides heparinolyticus]